MEGVTLTTDLNMVAEVVAEGSHLVEVMLATSVLITLALVVVVPGQLQSNQRELGNRRISPPGLSWLENQCRQPNTPLTC